MVFGLECRSHFRSVTSRSRILKSIHRGFNTKIIRVYHTFKFWRWSLLKWRGTTNSSSLSVPIVCWVSAASVLLLHDSKLRTSLCFAYSHGVSFGEHCTSIYQYLRSKWGVLHLVHLYFLFHGTLSWTLAYSLFHTEMNGRRIFPGRCTSAVRRSTETTRPR